MLKRTTIINLFSVWINSDIRKVRNSVRKQDDVSPLYLRTLQVLKIRVTLSWNELKLFYFYPYRPCIFTFLLDSKNISGVR